MLSRAPFPVRNLRCIITDIRMEVIMSLLFNDDVSPYNRRISLLVRGELHGSGELTSDDFVLQLFRNWEQQGLGMRSVTMTFSFTMLALCSWGDASWCI